MARLWRSLTAGRRTRARGSGRSPTAEVTVSKTRLGPPTHRVKMARCAARASRAAGRAEPRTVWCLTLSAERA